MAEPLTDAQLQEIEAGYQNLPPGPWQVIERPRYWWNDEPDFCVGIKPHPNQENGWVKASFVMDKPLAEFFANSQNRQAMLVAEVRRLREYLERIRLYSLQAPGSRRNESIRILGGLAQQALEGV